MTLCQDNVCHTDVAVKLWRDVDGMKHKYLVLCETKLSETII